MGLILVVDDEECIRTLAKEVLEPQGHIVVTADTGREALQLWQQRSFDLLVTDVQMPAKSGLDLIRAIKAALNVPILVFSGTHTGRSLQTATSLGTLGILTKPFTVAELLGTVYKTLDRTLRLTHFCDNCDGKIVYQRYTGKPSDSVEFVGSPVCGKPVPELSGAKVVAYFKRAAKGAKSGQTRRRIGFEKQDLVARFHILDRTGVRSGLERALTGLSPTSSLRSKAFFNERKAFRVRGTQRNCAPTSCFPGEEVSIRTTRAWSLRRWDRSLLLSISMDKKPRTKRGVLR